MLRFLTNKLKSHSLTEDQGGAFDKKAQDNHDSGTESDDEPSGSEPMGPEEYASEWGSERFYPLPGLRGDLQSYS